MDAVWTTLVIIGNILALSVILGNGFVVLVMFRYRKEFFKIISMTYLFQLSICDIFFAISCILTPHNYKLLGYEIPKLDGNNFVDNYIICRAWEYGSIYAFFGATSLFTMTLLTLERYLKIVYPLWYKVHITDQMIVRSLAVPWTISFSYFCIFVAFLGNIKDDGICYQEFTNDTVAFILTVCPTFTNFLLPIGTFIVCYSRIWMVIRKRVVPSNEPKEGNAPAPDTMSAMALKNKEIERNTIKTMLTVCLVFFVTFIGMQIYTILVGITALENETAEKASILVFIGALINSFINPFIYIAKYKNFRKYAREFLGCK